MTLIHNSLMKKLKVNYLIYSHISAKLLRTALKPELKKNFDNKYRSLIQIFKFENNKKGDLVQTLVIGERKEEDEHHDVAYEQQKADHHN
ncbi:unnamed protein product [Acanthoscelides obtectus]|uniref:Uncharacterized protein n=1 Tax=Acanthoscelides obtectus TaxID=200917 RepID=A0A9P0KP58_ACAOB|nr:unnamed protein product [Acanthoscelides obtectus]CAK1650022.1 hypothetical protein AOBTE_LOCUS16548 [Acanthoscelides obtectus]